VPVKRFDQGPGPDQVAYQIKVGGRLAENWSGWFDGMTIEVDNERGGPPVTTLTGVVDRSALHGILFRILDLNLPLISVARIEPERDE
jgi:hypothetical protein